MSIEQPTTNIDEFESQVRTLATEALKRGLDSKEVVDSLDGISGEIMILGEELFKKG